MYKVLFLAFVLSPVGCRFAEWATTGTSGGDAPVIKAAQEVVTVGLTGFETGGIVAGVIGLLFTVAKTGSRLYADYQESKKTAKLLGPKQ